MKKIGIFTTNVEFVLERTKQLAWRCQSQNINNIRHLAPHDISIECSNGEYYQWIKPNSRGQKVTDAIIDIATCSYDEISTIMLFSIVNFEREPEITIVDSHPDKEFYDIDTLIDRLKKVRLIKGNLEICYLDTEWGNTEIANIDITNNNQLRLL